MVVKPLLVRKSTLLNRELGVHNCILFTVINHLWQSVFILFLLYDNRTDACVFFIWILRRKRKYEISLLLLFTFGNFWFPFFESFWRHQSNWRQCKKMAHQVSFSGIICKIICRCFFVFLLINKHIKRMHLLRRITIFRFFFFLLFSLVQTTTHHWRQIKD